MPHIRRLLKPALLVVIIDITARKKSEEALRQAHDELARLSTTDAMTGTRNRRFLDDNLGKEWRWAVRQKRPFSVLMVDVDWFKELNDRYGHLIGDACLVGVAAVLMRNLSRPHGIVARYGGDEFVMVLPDTDRDGAVVVADRILEEARGIEVPGLAEGLTLSIGLVTCFPFEEVGAEGCLS